MSKETAYLGRPSFLLSLGFAQAYNHSKAGVSCQRERLTDLAAHPGDLNRLMPHILLKNAMKLGINPFEPTPVPEPDLNLTAHPALQRALSSQGLS
jgi:hypothetical protein